MTKSGKRFKAVLFCAFFFAVTCCSSVFAGEDMPKISDLVKKADKEEAKEGEVVKADAFPRKLAAGEANLPVADLLPPGPLLFLQVNNGAETVKAFDKTAFMKFAAEKKVVRFNNENDFSLASLFVDLPETYIKPANLAVFSAVWRYVKEFSNTESGVAVAAYGGGGSGLQVIFLSGISGLDRKAAFDKLQQMRKVFIVDKVRFTLIEDDHSDDYIDVIRSEDGKAELAFGIVRNYVVVSTSASFAKSLKENASRRGSGTLGSSKAYLAMTPKTDPFAHVKGFVDMRSLLAELSSSQLPGAAEMVDFACDIAGRGRHGEMIYYDLRAAGDKVVEHIVSPTGVEMEAGEKPGIVSAAEVVCKSVGDKPVEWTTPKLVPYQPELFVAAQVKPAAFIELMKKRNPFGSSVYSSQLAGKIPSALYSEVGVAFKGVLPMLEAQAGVVLTGEAAFALLPEKNGKNEWIILLSVADAHRVQGVVANGEPVETANKVGIFSANREDWRNSQCWAVINRAEAQNLVSSQLVITSSGTLMQTIVDQTVAIAASLSENKDFKSSLSSLGGGYSMVFYYNLRSKINRDYININKFVEGYFPHLENVANRPPMSLVSGYASGVMGGMQLGEDGTVKTRVVGPLPVVPVFGAGLVMNLPSWIRERSRKYMSGSRSALSRMWFKLQTYATVYGHYPENTDELQKLFSPAEAKQVFINPAAVDAVGLNEATRSSYTYVHGLRPTDEPDMPLVYETRAWHHEYRGMLEEAKNEPTESGPYEKWHLVLTIDGKVKEYTEKEFKRVVQPRIDARD